MKNISFIVIFLFCSLSLQAQESAKAQEQSSPLTFEQALQWVQSNIRFPNEALGYKAAGIETIAISATWDGRLFLVYRPNTLGVAYEDEIKRVVAAAPRCIPPVCSFNDAVTNLQVDFGALVTARVQRHINILKTPHTLPDFGKPGNSRENMLDWLYGNFSVPGSLDQYCDTVKVNYTIDAEGQVTNTSVSECRNPVLQKSLDAALRRAPAWRPAMTGINGNAVPVVVSDRMIVHIDGGSRMLPRKPYTEPVYCNSSTAPDDPHIIVSSPEVRPKYNGKETYMTFNTNVGNDAGIEVDRRTTITATFVTETDGSISNLTVYNAPDSTAALKLGSAILSNAQWSPAVQGYKPVRSAYRFTATFYPKSNSTLVAKAVPPKRNSLSPQDYYATFGKYWLFLNSDSYKTDYRYIYPNGGVVQYPFDRYGLFNYGNFNSNGYIFNNNQRSYFNNLFDFYSR